MNRDDVITAGSEAYEVLSHEDSIAFDLETTGLNPWRDNIALMQFYGEKSKRPVIIRIKDGVIPSWVHRIFSLGKTFVGHNITAFDNLFLETHGVPWEKSKWYDTLVGEGIISTTGRRDVSKSLKESVRRRLGLHVDKNIEHGNWLAETLSEAQLEYAVNDVIHLHRLMNEQINKAESQGQLPALEMEMELAPVVTRMTANGLPLRPDALNKWLSEQEALASRSEKILHETLGDINFNSPKQLIQALANVGVNVRSTRAEILQELARFGSDIAQTLLDYRAPAQRLKMYRPEWQAAHIIDGWVHPRFWQVGTDTLRFSSSDPNLQQVPKDGRCIIGNEDGLMIVSADYSQIEVRIAAEIAQDEVLRELLVKDDVHTAIASKIFSLPEHEISFNQRRSAKATTFTLLFGGGYELLLQNAKNSGANMTEDEAYDIFTKFFDSFEGLSRVRRQAYGMRDRRVVTIQFPNTAKRVLVGRNVTPTRILNTTVQGPAAIGMKCALLECKRLGAMKYVGGTVHDELVAAVPIVDVEEFSHIISTAMVEGMKRIFPKMYTKVEVKSGPYWQS